ncbi:FAD-dependent oxidoreductase [Gramella jeungdoensis]|uniref:FAD-dependent oxidoreductase n=1 Tax=Gramella jeungdoensis TaxID=708091 RepID=A0ABT0YYM8_9FLAO|nr:FAD-dependent oxidoreductase [Gramella jeungdoensis]
MLKKVIVIGGGIIGLCSAYYLLKEGYSVTVIEKEDLTKGASNINAGFIAPSHIISLASPGMINKGLKMMWNKSSPFYIKPRWDTEFLDWAWKFKKSSTTTKVSKSVPILKDLLSKSQVLFEELIREVDFPIHYEKKGLLSVYSTNKTAKEEIEKARKIKAEGLEVDLLNREEILELQPSLSDKVTGAVHYIDNSHATPNTFMRSLYEWLKGEGVKFNLEEEVCDFEKQGEKLIGVKTEKDFYTADEFILCAGSWTAALARKLDLKIVLQGGKGYSIDAFNENKISIPTILCEAKVAVTPMDGFTRFAGTMEFSGQNEIIRAERVKAIVKAATTYYKDVEISEAEIKAARSGLRPVSPDGLPYIGRPGKYHNLIISTGHAMIGWSLGPVTGKLVSDIIASKRTEVNMEPFSPERRF